MDFRTLRVENGSFVDRALRSRHSDLVLSVRMRGERVYIYVLVEHQRDVDPLMVVRMLIYMARLWEQLLRESPGMKAVPPIMPLLIHNSAGGWTAATAFQDVVAAEGEVRRALRPYIPRFEMRLIELGEGQARRLAARMLTAFGEIVLWCMSVAGDEARLEAELQHRAKAIEKMVQAPDGLAALGAVMRYIVATHQGMSEKKTRELLEKVGPRTKEAVVTWVDAMEQRAEKRGEKRGVRRGVREGCARMLLQQLAARFGEVPAEVAARVEAAGEGELDRWALRMLTAPTLEDALDDGEATGQSAPSTRRPVARKRARRARGARGAL
jgi:predicted transposase YdaD